MPGIEPHTCWNWTDDRKTAERYLPLLDDWKNSEEAQFYKDKNWKLNEFATPKNAPCGPHRVVELAPVTEAAKKDS